MPNVNVNERQLKIKILKLQIKMNATETITAILSVVAKILCSNVTQTCDVWTCFAGGAVVMFFYFVIFLGILLQYVAH